MKAERSRDLLFTAGYLLASYGAWSAYAPLGWLFAGGVLMVGALYGAILSARPTVPPQRKQGDS